MEDLRVQKLREKLGISVSDQQASAGTAMGPNLQKKISGYAGGRRQFRFCAALSRIRRGGKSPGSRR